MAGPRELYRKVFDYTGDRTLAERAVHECFGTKAAAKDLEPRAAGDSAAENGVATSLGDRVGVWMTQGAIGFFTASVAFVVLVTVLQPIHSPEVASYSVVFYLVTLASGFSGGLTSFASEGTRPGSTWKWAVGVALIALGLLGLSLGVVPLVEAVYVLMRRVDLVGPAPESSDFTGVPESFLLVALCVSAAAPLSGALASRLRPIKSCGPGLN